MKLFKNEEEFIKHSVNLMALNGGKILLKNKFRQKEMLSWDIDQKKIELIEII